MTTMITIPKQELADIFNVVSDIKQDMDAVVFRAQNVADRADQLLDHMVVLLSEVNQ